MSNTDLYQKVTQFRADVDIAHRIVHGGPTEVIDTEGGSVRTLAKLISDNQLVIDEIPALQEAVVRLNAEKQELSNLAQDLLSPDRQTYPSTVAVSEALTTLRNQLAGVIDNYHRHPLEHTVAAHELVVVDSALISEVSTIKWVVEITSQSETGLKRQVMEIMATHNGNADIAPTAVDFATYAILKLGSVVDLVMEVDVVEVGGAHSMVLTLTAAEPFTVKSFREQTF